MRQKVKDKVVKCGEKKKKVEGRKKNSKGEEGRGSSRNKRKGGRRGVVQRESVGKEVDKGEKVVGISKKM